MRLLYLSPPRPGGTQDLQGWALIDMLQDGMEVRLAAAVGPSWETAASSPTLGGTYRGVQADELSAFDAIYVEQGWDGLQWFPREMALGYVEQGGNLIVADAHWASLLNLRRSTGWAAFALARAELLPPIDMVGDYPTRLEGEDPERGRYWFESATWEIRARVAQPFRAALDNVTSLLVEMPSESLGSETLALTNLAPPRIAEPGGELLAPLWGRWATTRKIGLGRSLLLTAGFTHVVSEHPDNGTWMRAAIEILVELTARERALIDRPSPERLMAAVPTGLAGLLDADESSTLERKAHFFARDKSTRDMRFEVAKAICAMANTSGGHIVLGQQDDRQINGLDSEQKWDGADKFQQQVMDYLSKTLDPGPSAIGVDIRMLDRDGRQVAIVEIPKSARPVYVEQTDRSRQDASRTGKRLFVRRGPASIELIGKDLGDWIAARG